MAATRKLAGLSLGSNQGNRAQQIERALEHLEDAGVHVARRSSLFETEPVGMRAQRWFVNCAVTVETELLPLALLSVLRRIERALGRRPAAGPEPVDRPIDIDILFYDNQVVEMPELTIPHPRLAERRFVLEPLREVAPEWRHPLTQRTAGEMLGALTDRAAVRRWRGAAD